MLRRQFIQTAGAALAVLGFTKVFASPAASQPSSAASTGSANTAQRTASAVAKEVGLKPAEGAVQRKV